MSKLIPLFLVVLGITSTASALERDLRPPNDPSSIADEPKDPDYVAPLPSKPITHSKFGIGPIGIPKDTRRPDDASSISEEPQDPVEEPQPVPTAVPPAVPPAVEDPEITLESVTIKRAPKEPEPEITLESVVIRPLHSSHDLKKVRAWGNELATWLEIRSHCSGDTKKIPNDFEGGQKIILERIKELTAEFKKVSQTTLRYFRALNNPKTNLGAGTSRTTGLVPELATVSSHLDDDLKAMAEPVNFRGKGFMTFMAHLEFDLKQAKHNVDRSEHWTGITHATNGDVVVGHLDTDENNKLVRVRHQITNPAQARAWENYERVIARFRNVELKALHVKIDKLKHAALCQTAENKVTAIFARIAKERNPDRSFSSESAGGDQSNCQDGDKNIQPLLELQNKVGSVLLNLEGVPYRTRVVLSTIVESYRTRHGLHGSWDSLSEKQRNDLLSIMREALLRIP